MRGFLLIIAMTFISFSSSIYGADNFEYVDFYMDGCSMSPEGPLYALKDIDKNKWLHCCAFHDKEYFIGGTRKQKKEADKRFKQCIVNSGGSKFSSIIYYIGVRIGGGPYSPASFRWGYGLRQYKKGKLKKVGFRKLKLDTVSMALKKIDEFECEKNIVQKFSEQKMIIESVCNYQPNDFYLGDGF